MTDLAREQIEEWREMLIDPAPWASEAQRVRAINTLCNMALRSPAVPELQASVDRLTDCLNHAVTELSRAVLSENFDTDDCLSCIERIKDELKPMGKTSDWHILNDCYDRLCAACGVDNCDEIDILPIVEHRLRSLSPAVPEGCVVPRDFPFKARGNSRRKFKTHTATLLWRASNTERRRADRRQEEELAGRCDKAAMLSAPPAATGWVSVKDRLPDEDGKLWAILTPERRNGVVTGYERLYEYYHFHEGWATDEEVTHWLDYRLPPLPSPPGEKGAP